MKRIICFLSSGILAWAAHAQDFVYVQEIIPDAVLDIRYYSSNNFMGTKVDGYKKPIALLTKEAGQALKNVQQDLVKQGYLLKIYDAYRPQKGVNHFIRWAKDLADTVMKQKYYPDLDKSVLFEQGYIAEKSGHTRGSTLDLTIVHANTHIEVDMGSDWDFFGDISHHGTNKITDEQTANRMILLAAMEKHGFIRYDKEWWHYTLANEPFSSTYFDFDVE